MNDNKSTGLQPIIKWTGGKEKELKYILPHMPKFSRYFEPFVGGGSVFMAINAKKYYINDFSSELIDLYRNISTSNKEFFRYAELIDASWENALKFFKDNLILVDKYVEYRDEKLTKEDLKEFVHTFCIEKETDVMDILGKDLSSLPCILLNELETNLFRKNDQNETT